VNAAAAAGNNGLMSDQTEAESDAGSTDAVVVAASTDDPPRFGEIFDRHHAGVHRYLERRLGRDRADDLLGEVFRIAFERRASFRPAHVSARPWLLGIASNLVLKAHRSEGRRLRALARFAPTVGGGTDDLARVDDVLDAHREAAMVARALLGLDARDRDVVLLIAWEGLSYEEVAAALDIPVGTVRSRLNRARRKLREPGGDSGNEPATITMMHLPRKAVCE
jgi:RNA polymerase sigma factor (sigma-70 family)